MRIMKKLFIALLMIVTFCGNAMAQKGMHGIGVNGGMNYGEDVAAYGVGVKYQYYISNYVRVETSF